MLSWFVAVAFFLSRLHTLVHVAIDLATMLPVYSMNANRANGSLTFLFGEKIGEKYCNVWKQKSAGKISSMYVVHTLAAASTIHNVLLLLLRDDFVCCYWWKQSKSSNLWSATKAYERMCVFTYEKWFENSRKEHTANTYTHGAMRCVCARAFSRARGLSVVVRARTYECTVSFYVQIISYVHTTHDTIWTKQKTA